MTPFRLRPVTTPWTAALHRTCCVVTSVTTSDPTAVPFPVVVFVTLVNVSSPKPLRRGSPPTPPVYVSTACRYCPSSPAHVCSYSTAVRCPSNTAVTSSVWLPRG